MKEMTSASTSKAPKKVGAKAGNTMHIGGPMPGLLSPPSSPSASQPSSIAMESKPANCTHDPVDMVNSTVGLSYLFAITEGSVAKAIERNKLDPSSIMKTMEDLPSLTDDQLDQALSVIPQDYWRLTCWNCRHQGHTTFMCPSPTLGQRIFFAFCYYMQQVHSNPELKA